MDKSGRGRRVNNGGNVADEPNEFEIGLNSDAIFIIKVPDSRSLRVISRSLFLAAVLLSLPSIGSIIWASSHAPPLYDADADTANWVKNLPFLLRELMEEGLITERHKGFVLGSGEVDLALSRDAGVDLAAGADLRGGRVGAHQMFDYMLAASFSGIEQMDGAIRDGGLAVAPLGGDISAELRLLRRNFKIVYLRRLNDDTVVAMRKSTAAAADPGVRQRVLCGIAHEKKEAALRGLEDVYLEAPSRRFAKKSSFRFLPDLMKDPLDEYPRRVFIADESGAMDWFYGNYPVRGQEFQVYSMEEDWIAKTGVRAEDYVVVKAEAGAVEQMLRDKTLCVVDELFLGCREDEEREGGGERGRKRKRKRAYWECVALYGKIRDEGIAVHQWW